MYMAHKYAVESVSNYIILIVKFFFIIGPLLQSVQQILSYVFKAFCTVLQTLLLTGLEDARLASVCTALHSPTVRSQTLI